MADDMSLFRVKGYHRVPLGYAIGTTTRFVAAVDALAALNYVAKDEAARDPAQPWVTTSITPVENVSMISVAD